uniref:Fcr2 n=1 Tax=Arundo donax TaxID=35708 RepID=A0A0A9CUC1_ARUDO
MMRHSSLRIHLYYELKISKIRIQCSRGIRLDYFFASSILSPATDMLANWKAQCRSRSWKSKFELGHVMTYLLLFDKFELLEVLRIQAALGLLGSEEEEGAPSGDRDDGDGDGHRGLDALPLQEIHDCGLPPRDDTSESVGGFGRVWGSVG